MSPIQQPAMAPHLLAQYLPGEGLFVVSEHGSNVLVGEVFANLLPLLTGTLSVDEILDRATGQHSEAEVLYALDLLESTGYLVDGCSGSASQSGYWSARKAPASSRKLTIVNHSSQDLAPLAELIAEQGLELHPSDGLRVVLVDDYLDPVLETHNKEWLASGTPWMLVKPTGNILWFGPIFVPGKTGCWECMANRLRLNRRVLGFLERRVATPLRFPPVSAPVTRSLAASIAVNEVIQWLCGSTSIEGTLRTFDTTNHAIENHALVRRPHCPSCGTPARPRPRSFSRSWSSRW